MQEAQQNKIIRRACDADIGELLNLYAHARRFMAEHGNPTQWGTSRPTPEQIRAGVARCVSFVCEERGQICAAFEFIPGPDPTYAVIREGAWLDADREYRVIHRMASYGGGAGMFCLTWCWNQWHNLRIDTHRDNYPMQNLIRKCGFTYCGLIDTDGNGERLAYQKIILPCIRDEEKGE